MLRLRCAAAAIALLVAVALLALPSNGATAQEPLVMAFEQPASGTVALQPGINEVGWLTESADPQALFDEIPQLETIWTWHTLDQRWQAAARDVPSNLWTLYRLVPGMGLRLQIAGNAPVNWQRSLVPASGKVELQPGNNFVAWAGRDGWDVNQLAKGIGRQLQEINQYDPAASEFATIWPVAEGAEPATVVRGEALWVKMPRSIVWLQPTDIMPRFIFPDNTPEDIQAAVRRDFRNTLDYFAIEHGIQADTAGRVVSVYNGTGGSANRLEINIGVTSATTNQRIATHEYSHWVQFDLLKNLRYDNESQWITEGSADYAGSDQDVMLGIDTWPEIVSHEQQRMYEDVPQLSSVEKAQSGIDGWQYYLGRLALRLLVERSQPSAWVDFYRESGPTSIGPAGRWRSILSWRDVFASTFDIELDEFYSAFDQMQADLVMHNDPAAEALADNYVRIEGRIVRTDGSAVAGRVSASWSREAKIDANGDFSVVVPNDGQYHLPIFLGDESDCIVYYADGSVTLDEDSASRVRVAGPDPDIRLDIRVPDGFCSNTISGRLLDQSGKPMAGVSVQRKWDGGRHPARFYSYILTDSTGAFNFAVNDDTSHSLEIILDGDILGCSVYFAGNGGVTGGRSPRAEVRVADEDVHIGDIRVPDGFCSNTISGRLLDQSGKPMARVPVRAGGETDTDGNGRFTIPVSEADSYIIRFSLRWVYSGPSAVSPDCNIYYNEEGVTADPFLATEVHIADGDVHIGDIRVPEGTCSNTISGRLLDSDGEPLFDVYIHVGHVGSGGFASGDTTYNDGAFTITVPQDGTYRLSIRLGDSCRVYLTNGSVTANHGTAAEVRVAGEDVQIGDIRIPDGICEL